MQHSSKHEGAVPATACFSVIADFQDFWSYTRLMQGVGFLFLGERGCRRESNNLGEKEKKSRRFDLCFPLYLCEEPQSAKMRFCETFV